MDLIELILRWEVIVGVAVLGAIIATIGNFMMARDKDADGLGRTVLRVGYGITFVSIALFIVAGFMSDT